jgi:transposase
MHEPYRLSLAQWVPQCRWIYDKFHVMQHANEAVTEVRRAEFFRKGGAARESIRGQALAAVDPLGSSEHQQETATQQTESGRNPELPQIKVPLGVVEAVNGNIKALLRRGRGYRDLDYLLLKAQRLAATIIKTEFEVSLPKHARVKEACAVVFHCLPFRRTRNRTCADRLSHVASWHCD